MNNLTKAFNLNSTNQFLERLNAENDQFKNCQLLNSVSPGSVSNSTIKTSDEDDECDTPRNNRKRMINDSDSDCTLGTKNEKMKPRKCNKCGLDSFVNRAGFYAHIREHIRPEKLLECDKCCFVTEYKHHFEYHKNKHAGLKPFQCDACSYRCENKAMLSSHYKSHSEIFQYRCKDCEYGTKYVHSLKLHLRKNLHEPDIALNPDGTPCHNITIDVYGTRRGPKNKSKLPIIAKKSNTLSRNINKSPIKTSTATITSTTMTTPMQSSISQSFMSNSFLPYDFGTGISNIYSPFVGLNQLLVPQTLPSTSSNYKNETEIKSENDYSDREGIVSLCQIEMKTSTSLDSSENTSQNFGVTHNLSHEQSEVVDLSKPNTRELPIKIPEISPSTGRPSRRKNKAVKRIRVDSPTRIESFESTENMKFMVSNEDNITQNSSVIGSGQSYFCVHCNITYGDIVLYQLHQSWHNRDNPYQCNMCGEECKNSTGLYAHIISAPHN